MDDSTVGDLKRSSRRQLLRGAAGAAGLLSSRLRHVAAAVLPPTRLPPAPGTGQTRLIVSPNPAPIDAPVTIQLTGLAPGKRATLRSFVTDAAGRSWRAAATFQADGRGVVDVATEVPSSGTYHVADPMGLVWSALPPPGVSLSQPFLPTRLAAPMVITASVGRAEIAHVEMVRQFPAGAFTVTLIGESQGVIGAIARPTGSAAAPGIVILGGSEGGLNPGVVGEAALLATHGFAALALAYFGIGSLPPTLTNIPLEYFGKAIAWFRAQPGVRGDRLAVLGHSRGAELALLLGATAPTFEAVISYVGSGVVFSGLPDPSKPAWTSHGQALPFVTKYDDRPNWERAAIPVERINGPVLLPAAGKDKLWPSADLSRFALDRLRRFHHPYPDTLRVYPDAGHGIVAPYVVTTTELEVLGGTAQGTAAADADSWLRVLRLLDTRLRR